MGREMALCPCLVSSGGWRVPGPGAADGEREGGGWFLRVCGDIAAKGHVLRAAPASAASLRPLLLRVSPSPSPPGERQTPSRKKQRGVARFIL